MYHAAAPFYTIGSGEFGRLASFSFPDNWVVHIDGVAYDQYSIGELGGTRPGRQWLTFPLPEELGRFDYPPPWTPSTSGKRNLSVKGFATTEDTLLSVEQIYVITEKSFVDRHEHLKRVFRRHSISENSIKWQFIWSRQTCNLKENENQLRKLLNLPSGSKFTIRPNMCPIIMKHVDAWHDISNRGLSLALILEDDPLFVPFFKEKLRRVIYTLNRIGSLRVNGRCLVRPNTSIPNNEWIHQEPMLVIGACFDFHDTANFQRSNRDAPPVISTHKESPTRCAHAYLLTACSAKALIDEIAANPLQIDTPDFLMNTLFTKSSILQSFWIDPPLVYQGNRVNKDLDQIPTFRETKYNLPLNRS